MHDTEAPTMTTDEIGIQLVAAQKEITRMRATLDEVRLCVRHSSVTGLRGDLIVALGGLDVVSGDALVRP